MENLLSRELSQILPNSARHLFMHLYADSVPNICRLRSYTCDQVKIVKMQLFAHLFPKKLFFGVTQPPTMHTRDQESARGCKGPWREADSMEFQDCNSPILSDKRLDELPPPFGLGLR